MNVMDGRRLLRALAFGGIVLLLAGGGGGFVVAASAQADDARTLTVPAPRPGDRAVYTGREVVLDETIAETYNPGRVTAEYEWLPERWEIGDDYGYRLVHPLRSTFTFRTGTEWENVLVREATYDAATGAPVSETQVWSGQMEGYCLCFTGYDDPGTIMREVDTRYDGYQGQVGPCGFRVPFQGKAYDGSDVWLQGNCDWPLGLDGFTFADQGWTETPQGRVRAFQGIEDPRFFLEFDEATTFPARATATLSEAIYAPYTYGRYFVLERTSFHHGTGGYTPLTATVLREPVVPVALAPRTPWGLDDSDVAHRFSLSEAYMAAMAQPEPLPGRGGPTAAQWLAAHPDAYLGSATTKEYQDRNGQPFTWWYLAWTDGTEVMGKQVYYGPVGADSILLPSATGQQAEVSDWPPEGGWPWGGGGLVQPEDVPADLPRPADLMARYSALTGDLEPNRYSFSIECGDDACSEPWVGVIVGRLMETAEGDNYHVNYADNLLRPYSFQQAHLMAHQDGRMEFRWMDVESQDAVFPGLTPPTDAADEAEDSHPSVAATWMFPDAPATAAGISLLALLASALYYFWPAVKGGAVGLFSRIEPDRVLDHPSRKTLFALIEANPGVHFQDLARRSGFGRGQLEHHLRKLEDAELVSRVQGSSYSCFFARGQHDRRVMAAAPLLRSDGGRNVLEALQQTPGATSRQLAARLGLSAGTVSYHVKRLRDAGLLESAGGSLHLTETGRKAGAVAA